jgi:hypothetical protein
LIVGLIGAAWLIAHADARALRSARDMITNDRKTTWHVNGVSVLRGPDLNRADEPAGGY